MNMAHRAASWPCSWSFDARSRSWRHSLPHGLGHKWRSNSYSRIGRGMSSKNRILHTGASWLRNEGEWATIGIRSKHIP